MAEYCQIPENADKVLFAEDLVSYVMAINCNTLYQQRTVEPFRSFIYNAFNETTKKAVGFLMGTTEMQHKLPDVAKIYTYLIFATDIGRQYFPDGFDPDVFLQYCVHLASMAAVFYNNGIPAAPGLAVLYIVNAIRHFDTTGGGWGILNRISKQIIIEAFTDELM